MSEKQALEQTFNIAAGQFANMKFDVKEKGETYLFNVQVSQLPNRADDIQVHLLDEKNYRKYLQTRRGEKTGSHGIQWVSYDSSNIRWSTLFFNPSILGNHYLVLDNSHSTITPKMVTIICQMYKNLKQEVSKPIIKNIDQISFPNLHEKIISVSQKLFSDGHYSQAIFEALKLLENEIKQKSGVKRKIGERLVNEVFNEDDPIILINSGKNDEDVDERRGFRFLFMGAFIGIKNPKSHSIQKLNDVTKAMEYLSFISLLLKRLEESKVKKIQKK